jgi:hypothetical protein
MISLHRRQQVDQWNGPLRLLSRPNEESSTASIATLAKSAGLHLLRCRAIEDRRRLCGCTSIEKPASTLESPLPLWGAGDFCHR